MSVRLNSTLPDPPVDMLPRASARVGTVARLLDCDESQVRRLVREGLLESHGVGKRGVRVYLDSVAHYQSSRSGPKPPARDTAPPEKPKRASPASRAAHAAAMAALRDVGLA